MTGNKRRCNAAAQRIGPDAGYTGRIVATKVLRDPILAREVADRLTREAQLLASLHHPNIATIFALEEGDGVRAIIQEFVEGPTLADLLRRGPLAVGEAVATARQIADALDVAHLHGIIHRDLKPANVKLTLDGSVKLLDFGLATIMNKPGCWIACAQNDTLRAVSARHSDPRLEPLAILVDQADEGNRRAAHLRSKERQVVKRLLGIGVENAIVVERFQPAGFIDGHAIYPPVRRAAVTERES